MALAETAQLIVDMNLKGNLARGLDGVNRQIDELARKSSVRGGVSQIGQGIGLGIKRGAVIAGVGVAAIATQVKAGVDSLRELESVQAQTRAGLESTRGASGQTAESIRALAEEYENLGGVIDDKVIQSAENILLTFTNIKDDAFEPALAAALDMSTRLGTDLPTAALQLGKALQDPIKGIGRLTRSGVDFTEQQKEQIKRYVELGDTAAAQAIILAEVNEEFGGSFEEAGKTNEATVARMADAFEDLQQNLATAFLPVIDRVARRLNEIFADEKTKQAVKDFGETLAGVFTEENFDRIEETVRGVFDYLASIPWGTIADGLRIAGSAAKVAVDAFRSLPPGVQNALITVLAANKLTGGLVASGLGQLASLALSSLKTITAANVTVIGTNVTTPGGGVPGTGTGTGGGNRSAGNLLGTAGLAGVGLAIVTGIGTELHANLAPIEHSFNELASQQGETRIAIETGVNQLAQELGVTPDVIRSRMIPLLEAGNLTWDEIVASVRNGTDALTTHARIQEQRLSEGNRYVQNLNNSTIAAGNKTAAHLDTVRARVETGNIRLSAIAAKRTTFTVNNNVNVAVSTSVLAQGIYQQAITQHSGTQDSQITVI